MSSIFGASIGILMALPVLIAQWLGVIGLAKSGRNGAWWCMAVGTVIGTVGVVLRVVFQFWILRGSGGIDNITAFATVMSGFVGLGGLLFFVGFGIHGMMSKKMHQRVEEMESVLAAQGEQLGRQDQVGRS